MVLKVERMRKTAAARAETMGRRAGEALRDLGEPTANPFYRTVDEAQPGGHSAALARAWAMGYIAGLQGGA